MSYLEQHGTRETPQTEKIPGSAQVENSAGGYAWSVDDWTRLRRFLILGSEGGSYYATEGELTTENVECVRRCLAADGIRFVDMVTAISVNGNAPSNDPALFALAVAIQHGDKQTKSYAAESLPEVARIGTHLYHFLAYAETQGGWGRTLRWAVSNWYLSKPTEKLAYDAVKYRQRDGWSHRDALRLAHPKASDSVRATIFDWITHPDRSRGAHLPSDDPLRLLYAFEQAQAAPDAAWTAKLVRDHGLPREALRTDHLSDPDVWRALLDVGMPYTALTRNLANMTRLGVLDGDYRGLVLDQLANGEAIRKSRLHPLAILNALRTYAAGRGFRGTNSWTPLPKITDALDMAFYLAFDNVEPTGKRILLALDVSPSMAHGQIAGSPLTPREASAALALVTLNVEPNVEVVAFAGDLEPIGLSSRQRLDDAVRSVSGINWARTDCALPMQYAMRTQTSDFDAFQIFTDNETYYGNVHPAQALNQYRNQSGIAARLAVVGMVANPFTIADPNDNGMLDVVGFDSTCPALISDFISGKL